MGQPSPAPDVITVEVPPWRQRRADPRSQAIDSPNLTWCVADRSWSRPSHLAVTRIPPSCPNPLIAAPLAREDARQSVIPAVRLRARLAEFAAVPGTEQHLGR